jgi:hypothetical protein
LVLDRASDRLDPWLNQAVRSTLRSLRSFAKHLSADYDAVRSLVGEDPRHGHGFQMPIRVLIEAAHADMAGALPVHEPSDAESVRKNSSTFGSGCQSIQLRTLT